jgi:hypothetical protein
VKENEILETLDQENVKSLDIGRLCHAIELAVNSNKAMIKVRKIVLDKKYRPKRLSDQYRLLLFISRVQGLDKGLRLNSAIAAGHKAMEAMDRTAVDESIEVLKNWSAFLEEMECSAYIREDRVHASFSRYSVMLHMYLYSNRLEEFIFTSNHAASEFKVLDTSTLTPGFYQTCTNVSRCLGFFIISCLLPGGGITQDIFHDIKCARQSIRTCMSIGLAMADTNQTKFKEFTRDLSIYDAASETELLLRASQPESLEPIFRLYGCCIRKNEKKKVEHLYNVYKNSIEPALKLSPLILGITRHS